jgi:hypothetical protein
VGTVEGIIFWGSVLVSLNEPYEFSFNGLNGRFKKWGIGKSAVVLFPKPL